jgi:GTP-binding protein HflX
MSEQEERPRAIVIGVQLPDVDDVEHDASLRELTQLAKTLGLDVVERMTQRRKALDPAAVFGDGKLKELAAKTGGTGVVPMGAKRKRRRIDPPKESEAQRAEETEGESDDESGEQPEKTKEPRASIVLVDHDLTPSQARNLERATEAEVLDRTSVILAIFQRHARTREARLQVEIARLVYEAPRMRESGGKDRQRGGIGGKGAGESAIELDRRRIRDRIAELREELEQIAKEAGVRRARRSESATVALVGYTNAGKSSWMRVLTGGDVYVADKLFATLDTTVRSLVPAAKPPILVSDTVGFIKKLPHDLVASFRSTLEEARDAGLLLHVVDASDPAFRDQLSVTRQVLKELNAGDAPSLLLLNKIDRVEEEQRTALAAEFPDALLVSARDPTDIARVHARVVEFFLEGAEEVELFIPWSKHAVVAAARESAVVTREEHEDDGTRLTVRATPLALARLRSMLD